VERSLKGETRGVDGNHTIKKTPRRGEVRRKLGRKKNILVVRNIMQQAIPETERRKGEGRSIFTLGLSSIH